MKPELWGKLPNELLEKIQLRLPARELIKLRSVSRGWNMLINNPSFVAAHREFHQQCCTETIFLLSCDATPRCTFNPLPAFQVKNSFELWLLDGKGGIFKLPTPDIGIPDRLPCRYLRSANGGLILMLAYDTEFREGVYFVWNPCTRQFVSIGSPNLWGILLDGIVVDTPTREFTVVCVGRVDSDAVGVSTMVYNLHTGWRLVPCSFPYEKCNRIRGALTNSGTKSCTWLVEDASQPTKDRFLATFYTSDRIWRFVEASSGAEWIDCEISFKHVISGPSRNNFAAIARHGVVCFLAGNQRLYVKHGAGEWCRLEKPKTRNPFSNLLVFNLSL